MKRPWLWLAGGLAIVAAVLVAGQGDFVASDPLWYADISHTVAHGGWGVFSPAEVHPFVMRVGLTLPLAMIFKVFGVSTLTANLPALLSGLACILLAYLAVETPRAKLLAVFFTVTCGALMRQSVLLNIDLPCATLLGYSVLFMSRRDRGAVWLVAAIVTVVIAFLVKETAVWCAPIWLWAFVVDARDLGLSRALRRYLPALVIGVVLIATYLAVCAKVWGDPLARFHGIEEVSSEHAWTLHGKPASAWLTRLTYAVPVLLWKMYGVALIPALAAVVVLRGRQAIWLVSTGTFLVLYWFGTVSLSSYSPLPISERMAANLLPCLLICAALATDAVLDRGRIVRYVAALLGLVLVIATARTDWTMARRSTPETEAFSRFRALVATSEGPTVLVCTDNRGSSIANFYFGLETPAKLTYAQAQTYAKAQNPPGAHVYVLVNDLRAHDASVAARIDSLKLPAVLTSNFVRLYDAGDGTSVSQ
jgi:hypothetical protein